MEQLTSNELREKISNWENFVLDLYAVWCGPCKVMLNNLERVNPLRSNPRPVGHKNSVLKKPWGVKKCLGVRTNIVYLWLKILKIMLPRFREFTSENVFIGLNLEAMFELRGTMGFCSYLNLAFVTNFKLFISDYLFYSNIKCVLIGKVFVIIPEFY